MKKLFCILILSLLMQSSQAQRMPTGIAVPELWEKSKTQRTTAFVLLGVGALTTLISFSVGANHVFTDLFRERSQVRGTGGMIAGITLMAGSIPFFTMSGKNRRASLSVSNFSKWQLNNQQLFALQTTPQFTIMLTSQIF